MSTLNIQLLCRRSIDFPELVIFASRPGTMINLHWFELPMARTLFHGPKGVRDIEVRLYMFLLSLKKNFCCEYSLKYPVVIPISTHKIHFYGEIKKKKYLDTHFI